MQQMQELTAQHSRTPPPAAAKNHVCMKKGWGAVSSAVLWEPDAVVVGPLATSVLLLLCAVG